MLIAVEFQCPVCCSPLESSVDPSQGASQRYVEDCQVCCRPLVLHVTVDDDTAVVLAEPESM